VSLRLLGVGPDDKQIIDGRAFIKKHGGAVTCPSWAKFWLSLLGVHEWSGVNSIPAEMWLLPNWFPFHPGKLWCHCRMVYLPMCYLYCKRFENPGKETDPLLESLRSELYITVYAAIQWDAYRHVCCPLDDYSPVTLFQKTAHNILAFYETYFPIWKFAPFSWVREAGINFAIRYIHAEDLQTNYVDIGPVNKTLNMLSIWVQDGHQKEERYWKHAARLDDYLWVAEDGMKMQGYNGSQCWDTSFAAQAFLESGMAEDFPDLCRGIYTFLERTQILSTPTSQASEAVKYEGVESRQKYFRHTSKGGWPFSTSAHGWPISDCTAEGLKGMLALMPLKCVESSSYPETRLFDAVNVLLSYQNSDGGWATYENNRGFGFYEWMNPSEVFGDIMIDYSYVECSSASMTALYKFQKLNPDHRTLEIQAALERGGRFLEAIQRPDGSWYGSWGVCFTYACFFGIEGLLAAGRDTSCPAIQRCVTFVLSKQNPDGGWAENYLSCVDKVYTRDSMFVAPGCDSGVVQTAWSLLALMAAEVSGPGEVEAVERGARFLMSKQQKDGDWAQENITGVFNRSCGITYTAYRNVFPIWALGRYGRWKKTACGKSQ